MSSAGDKELKRMRPWRTAHVQASTACIRVGAPYSDMALLWELKEEVGIENMRQSLVRCLWRQIRAWH